jgi:rhodanese-related sulfurtransferase
LKATILKGEPVMLLDVREQVEVDVSPLGGDNVVSIPLSELRDRLGELPKDKPIVCMCPMGIRAYDASMMLRGAGLEDVRFVDGGMRVYSSVPGD